MASSRSASWPSQASQPSDKRVTNSSEAGKRVSSEAGKRVRQSSETASKRVGTHCTATALPLRTRCTHLHQGRALEVLGLVVAAATVRGMESVTAESVNGVRRRHNGQAEKGGRRLSRLSLPCCDSSTVRNGCRSTLRQQQPEVPDGSAVTAHSLRIHCTHCTHYLPAGLVCEAVVVHPPAGRVQ